MATFGCCDFGTDLLIETLASLDIGSDFVVVIQRLFFTHDDYIWTPLWTTGFALFCLSLLVRMWGEFYFYNFHDKFRWLTEKPWVRQWGGSSKFIESIEEFGTEKSDDCGNLVVMICVPICFPYVVTVSTIQGIILSLASVPFVAPLLTYKAIRVILLPLDLVGVFAYRMSKARKWKFPIAQSTQFHDGMNDFFDRMPLHLKYINMIEDLTAGGRFKICYVNHGMENDTDRAWAIVMLAIVEEFIENTGSILMNADTLAFGSNDFITKTLAWVSLGLSIVSFVFETIKYVGDKDALVKGDENQDRSATGTANSFDSDEQA